MYEQPKKLGMTKIIEICILIFLIIWGVVLLINYKRYCDTKKPILMIHSHSDYDDGYVDDYIGLFYNIRYYRRISITRDEMVPFWKFRENPEAQPDLPVPEKGYNVPENNQMLDKFRGLLYFYDGDRNLIGTYKCINGKGTCNKVTTGWDKYNTIGNNPLIIETEPFYFDIMYNKYAWIDDSYTQTASYGDPTYERIIYLFKIDKTEPEILAKYADIKQSTYDDDKEVVDGYNHQYIVKSMDSGKWGMVKIKESGEIVEVIPFEYDSITYDLDTRLYILCKNDIWFVKDIQKDKTIIDNVNEPIFDVWMNSNLTYYYFTGVSNKILGVEQYVFKIYKGDGSPFLVQNGITGIYPFKKCIMYVDSNDNNLKFMNYGKEVQYSLPLNFSIMKHDDVVHPAVMIYEIEEDESSVRLRIYESHNKSNEYDSIGINLNNLSDN